MAGTPDASGRVIDAETLLRAYMAGIFPMAEDRDARELFWVDPERRGVIPLGALHISRSLRRDMRRTPHDVRRNTAFGQVVSLCAAREETWINADLKRLYLTLHHRGFAHSIEVWEGGMLAGGVFGVAIGGAFFGESMFSDRPSGSKMALVYLVDLLRRAGFTLFDTQFITAHLASMGAIEIPRYQYRADLSNALRREADFTGTPLTPSLQDVLQRNTHTS
ncbi:MAG: leucyl/phenylalanyl-tRNA--protein transferase [Shimia sp.]